MEQQHAFISDAYVQSSSLGVKEYKQQIAEDSNGEPVYENFMQLEGEFTRSEHLNKNKRYYPDEIVNRENSRLTSIIESQNGIPSQLDHPLPSQTPEGIALVKRNSLSTACGVIGSLEKNNNTVYGKLKVLNEGINGTQLKAVLRTGFKVGISSRAVGGNPIVEGERLRVPDNIQFITYDVVSNPSNHSSILEQAINEEFEMFNQFQQERNRATKTMFQILEEYV